MGEIKGRIKGRKERKIPVVPIIFISAILLLILFLPKQSELISYPDRGEIRYESTILKEDDLIVEEVVYESRDENISALLWIPSTGKRVPGIVWLPGRTVPKEGIKNTAILLSEWGYATLAIDQRGEYGIFGYWNTERELELFKKGKEPLQWRMVYDALKAYDLLSSREEIDPEKIIMIGESVGGRFAIIATALEEKIKGVIGISTFGDGAKELKMDKFFISVDPDSYVGEISPRYAILIHGERDPIVPVEMAERTFAKANEPKIFYKVNSSCHGYCKDMEGYLKEGLERILYGP
jgi:hypothetical protein